MSPTGRCACQDREGRPDAIAFHVAPERSEPGLDTWRATCRACSRVWLVEEDHSYHHIIYRWQAL